MRLQRVRLRLLAAMGIPMAAGCGAGANELPPPSEGPQPVVIDPSPQPTSDNVVATDPPVGSCGVDEVREQICGGTAPGSGCGTDGQHLTSYGEMSFVLGQADYSGHSASFAPFANDESLTQKYREHLAQTAPHIENREDYCCYSHCLALVVSAHRGQPVPPGMQLGSQCIPAPNGTRHPAAQDPSCPATVVFDRTAQPFVRRSNNMCCYQKFDPIVHDPMPHPNRGRPMRVDRVSVLAELHRNEHWIVSAPRDLPTAAGHLRQRVRERWLEEARLEHASVAAFSKLALQLLSMGAPPSLVDAAHRAARDEIEHAQLAFSMAAAFADAPLGPQPVASWTTASTSDRLALLEETLLDGCVGETVAAEEASRAASLTPSVELSKALAKVAAEEQNHAELAWRVASWLVGQLGAAGVELIRSTYARLRNASRMPVGRAGAYQSDTLEPFGLLDSHQSAAIRREVVAEVVLPCLEGLLLLARTDEEGLADASSRASASAATTEQHHRGEGG